MLRKIKTWHFIHFSLYKDYENVLTWYLGPKLFVLNSWHSSSWNYKWKTHKEIHPYHKEHFQESEFVNCQKGCQSMCTPGLSLCFGQKFSEKNGTKTVSSSSSSSYVGLLSTTKTTTKTTTTTSTTTTTAGPIYVKCICKKSTLARSPGV